MIKRKDIPALLSQFDALYIGLQRESLFRFGISPNKLMDYMMAAKPVILAIEAGNDMVADAGCGISIPPEDSGEIAAAVLKLSQMSADERQKLGANGRAYILENHEYDGLSKRFMDVFSMPRQKNK